MVLCLIFEMTGALAVGARTASTIKNGIIPLTAFRDDAGVQLLAFACASAGAASWVMWCTRHSAHVSSTYSLISSIAGVGVATVGVNGVQWGWNKGQGLGAIFAGLAMAPAISGGFAAVIFLLIKFVVHLRSNPVPWAVWTSPFFFLIAGTICTLSVVYKGSPKLKLNEKPAWYIAAVTMGVGWGLFVLACLFFVPFVHAKVVKKDYTLKAWEFIYGPLLFKRPAPADAESARVPNYAVVQHGDDADSVAGVERAEIDDTKKSANNSGDEEITPAAAHPDLPHGEKSLSVAEGTQADYRVLMAQALDRHHATLRKKTGPIGWAMRTLHENPVGAGSVYEKHNMIAHLKRLPAYVIVAFMYGLYYDIHTAQVGIHNTPEGRRMDRVYRHATKYPNEVEYLYSFVQIITACTASFAHGANDVGNAVGVWAAMYGAWSTGKPVKKNADVDTWQIAVIALTICFGFITYGYNIMKGKPIQYSFFKIIPLTEHSHG
jgi:sodium-dependent phosphate transporter